MRLNCLNSPKALSTGKIQNNSSSSLSAYFPTIFDPASSTDLIPRPYNIEKQKCHLTVYFPIKRALV